MRQGTSRIVPVVVSAGLAMGVFCGLLFGLGTGKRSASADPPRSNGVKRVDDSFTPESMANPNVKIPDKNAPKAEPAAGSAVATATGSGAGTAVAAGSAEPAIKPTKLIVEIKPEAAASAAKVFIDGKPIEGTTVDITPDPGMTKKTVKVLVKAPSYKDVEQEIEVEGESTTLKLDFYKTGRATGATAGTEGGTGASAGTGTSGGAAGHTGGTTGAGGSTGASGSGNTGGGNGAGKATGNGKGSSSKGKGKGSGGLIDI
jgi:hypothetical protein